MGLFPVEFYLFVAAFCMVVGAGLLGMYFANRQYRRPRVTYSHKDKVFTLPDAGQVPEGTVYMIKNDSDEPIIVRPHPGVVRWTYKPRHKG